MPAITDIQPQRRPGRYSIFIDREFVIGVGEKVVATLGLRIGDAITPERLVEIGRAEELRRAMDNAYKLLESRPRAIREVRDRLSTKGYEQDIIDTTIARLTEMGLLDDAEFARLWVESRSRSSPSGPRKLRSELAAKGIDREQVDNLIGGIAEDDRLSLARKALAPKLRGVALSSADCDIRRAEYTRLAGFLQRRGFDWDIVKQALREAFDGDEINDEVEG